MLFKDLAGKYLTLKDCIEAEKKTEENAEDAEEKTVSGDEKKDEKDGSEKEKTTIYYVTDEVLQSQYINLFKEAGKNAVLLKDNIDTPFISHLERKNESVQFRRIDADLSQELRSGESTDEEMSKALTELFRKELKNEKLEVKTENLKNQNIAAMITLPEESRRMQDMMKMYNMYGMDPSAFGGQEVLVLNTSHPLVKYVSDHKEEENTGIVCEQLYDLAMLGYRQLTPDEMTRFVARSNEILMKLTR